MPKLFTITEGLENLGALKTGGQGSVYKAKRPDGTMVAVKILFTPIFNENDKAYRDFDNEVEKLKKVNQQPNPHVVKIFNSGLTETGSFPYIEMELVDGPDVEELLKPPHNPVFGINEIIKVAEHLSNALAHCHSVEVKHGDIKSNNVKYNIHTGHYMLLDFGLAALSDEQRRTSLRQAGAIEFMAPEQSEGTVLFQTDVYSFGVVLYELIAGRVPFPLGDRNESSRSKIMLAHREAMPPDVMALRKQNLPASCSESQKKEELQVPLWLLQLVTRCLQKDPFQRFRNGRELYETVIQQLNSAENMFVAVPAPNSDLEWLQEKKSLQQQLHQQQKQINDLRQQVLKRDEELKEAREQHSKVIPATYVQQSKGVSSAAFYTLLLVTCLLAAFAAYFILAKRNGDGVRREADYSDTTQAPLRTEVNNHRADTLVASPPISENTPIDTTRSTQTNNQPVTNPMSFDTTSTTVQNERVSEDSTSTAGTAGPKKYKVKTRAYFHDEPDVATRRNAYIVQYDNAVLTPIDEKDGFVYIVFTNAQGQTSKGWILKSDLEEIKQ